jgi:hypothetical protein
MLQNEDFGYIYYRIAEQMEATEVSIDHVHSLKYPWDCLQDKAVFLYTGFALLKNKLF